jgi:hypothetical protein
MPTLGGTRISSRSAVQARFPGRPIVGYEHGEMLGTAVDAGFVPVGHLRVWAR